MLRDEVEQYTKLTGEDGWKVPVMKVGAYLDGYNKGLEVFDKIRAEIEHLPTDYIETIRPHSIVEREVVELGAVMRIINKYNERK